MEIYENLNLVEICHGEIPLKSFSKLKRLDVFNCSNMTNIVPSHLLQRLQNIQTFKASSCKSVKNIFDCRGIEIEDGGKKMLSSLKDLDLSDFNGMTDIWKGVNQVVSLCNLKRVKLKYCKRLMRLFAQALVESLFSLEEMEITWCDNLEEIFATTQVEIIRCDSSEESSVKKEEKNQEKHVVVWKKDIHIPTSPSLGNLTILILCYCHKLKSLFSTSIVKGLLKLKILRLQFCSALQEIVTEEVGENGVTIERIVFPSLYEMDLGLLAASLVSAKNVRLNSRPWRKSRYINVHK